MVNKKSFFWYVGCFINWISLGFCQDGFIRDLPVTIKILPYVEEHHQPNHTLSVVLPHKAAAIVTQEEEKSDRYSNEYGLNKFFCYDHLSTYSRIPLQHADNDLEAYSSSVAQNESMATLLLKAMAAYRKDHLRKANPLIAQFVITFVQNGDSASTECQITIPSGLFVSSMDLPDFRLSRKGGGALGRDEFFYSSTLALTPHFKGCFFEKEDGKAAAEGSSDASKEFKEIQKLMKDVRADVIKSVQPKIDQFQKELRSDIAALEGEFLQSKNISNYVSNEGIYVVPAFLPGCFPVTLQRSHNAKGIELQEAHFKHVVKRVFGYPLDVKRETIFDRGVFGKFLNYLNHDPKQRIAVSHIFGKNILDEGCCLGCFETDFTYWFSDSEQVFIEWLEACDTIDFDTGNIDFHDYIYGNVDLSTFNEHSIITSIDIALLSYLDMCPACRGTFSLLIEKKNGQLSWVEQRVRKLIRAWIVKNKNNGHDYANIWSESMAMNMFCTSLAKCEKGEIR